MLRKLALQHVLSLLFLFLSFCTVQGADEFPTLLFDTSNDSGQDKLIPTHELSMPSVDEYSLAAEEHGCTGEPIFPSHTQWQNSDSEWPQNLSFFGGIDGSKQPQDYGVNANLGLCGNVNASFAIDEQSGLGLQLGTGIVASENAVRVYELLGEATGRIQSYTTIGVFQKADSGFIWAVAHDFLVEQSYDTFVLSQWRVRVGYDVDASNQFGITGQLRGLEDTGSFAGGPVSLRSINQSSLYWRHVWETATQTTFWLGLADGHGENNAVTGPSPAKSTVPVLGADFLAPLNDHFALYGETNLMMPADTGTVDAFLGIQWFPGGRAKCARRTRFAPALQVAAPTTFSVDLR